MYMHHGKHFLLVKSRCSMMNIQGCWNDTAKKESITSSSSTPKDIYPQATVQSSSPISQRSVSVHVIRLHTYKPGLADNVKKICFIQKLEIMQA